MKLGKLAPRIDSRTLKLAKYLPPSLPAPPPAASYCQLVPGWPMMLNDTLGDCVCAAAGHMVEQWTRYTREHSTVLPDSSILEMYEQVGGYLPGHPSTDNGCDMLTALKWWRKVGLDGHKIGAFVSVTPPASSVLNEPAETRFISQVKTALNLFGNVYLGLALPVSAQGQDVWHVPADGYLADGAFNSWGGHCVPAVAYNEHGLTVVTWGRTLLMTWAFLRFYCDEAYAVLSPDWIGTRGLAPSHFDLAQLNADLSAL